MKRENGILQYSFIFVLLTLSMIVIFEFPTVFYYIPLLIFSVWLVYFLIFNKSLHIPVAALLLIIFAGIYVYKIRDLNQDRFYPLYFYLYIVLFYIMGTNIVSVQEKTKIHKKENIFELVYISIAIFYIVYVFTTYAVDFIDGGMESFTPMFLWNEGSRASTDYGVMCLPVIIASVYLIFCRHNYTVPSVLLLLVIICNLLTQRRTVFMITPIIFAVGLVAVYVFGCWKRKTRLLFACLLFLLLLVSGGALYMYWDSVKHVLFEDSLGRLSFSDVLKLFNNARFVASKELLKNFSWSYNGGEHYAASYGNPHNMWLNIYDNAGTLPFILFLIFTAITVYYVVKLCLFAKEVSPGIKCLLFTSFIGMTIQCCIEPVLVSDVTFVMFTFFVLGAIKSFADCADKKYWITQRIIDSIKHVNKKPD